ncbi:hypothetical protein [Pseudomonas syringae group genomosp. 3]|nr:hypothetical protein [Pseudomonas syringae group genomosp. 3]
MLLELNYIVIEDPIPEAIEAYLREASHFTKASVLLTVSPRTMIRTTMGYPKMTTKVDCKAKAQAKAKLTRLHMSPKYRSFFDAAAIDAFSQVEGSAFAGRSIKRAAGDDLSPRG